MVKVYNYTLKSETLESINRVKEQHHPESSRHKHQTRICDTLWEATNRRDHHMNSYTGSKHASRSLHDWNIQRSSKHVVNPVNG
ncbi:hypothetical protein KEJ35_05880 [Candidatus Bathyarchaeota archaeon]|nr:hypothetical protein [Candidatus Bathyarchaeota archaeon]